MDRTTEQSLVARVLAQHRDSTTTMADTALRIPAERYVSADVHRRELATLFRRTPVFACMSTDIAGPGDTFVFESGTVPIVVVRARDGGVRAYVNVCRHRAATVVPDARQGARSFSCPFHGWVYDIDDGHLIGQPRSCDGFADEDDTCFGLRRLAVAEAHGMIIVHPDDDAPIEADQWLAGMGPDLDALAFATLTPYCRSETTWQCNWKLLLDTFLESYHVFALHRTTLAFYLGNASPFDAFGPHNRIVVPQASILEQADAPPETWQLLPYAVLQYFLAPNLIVSNLYGYVMTWRFVPRGAGATTVQHALYTYRPAESDADRAHFDERFEAARLVTSGEDFPASEDIHRNLLSGAIDATIAGRNEPGMVHFHRMIAAAVA